MAGGTEGARRSNAYELFILPSLGVFRYSGLFRLARLSRVARITRLLRTKGKRDITQDVLENRGKYAVAITFMTAFLVLVLTSAIELAFESGAAGANITTGGTTLRWAIVTITTVGYGDHYPITTGGRITAVFVMLAGVGIIGALASILSSVLLSGQQRSTSPEPAGDADVAAQLAQLKDEVSALRRSISRGRVDRDG
jgi:voltage-gated potassium channel